MSRTPVIQAIAVSLIMVVAASPAMAACSGPSLFESLPTSTGHDADEFALGDVDNDGEVDLVTVAFATNDIKVRLGNGDTTFSLPLTYAAPSPQQVALGDVNDDTFLDIIVSNEPGTNAECISFGSCAGFSVLLNDGDGTFGTATTVVVPFAAGVVSVDVGDFSDDGNPDVLIAGPAITGTDPQIHVMFGDGSGTSYPTRRSWTVDGTVYDAIAAKLDGPLGVPAVVAVVGPGSSSTFTRVNAYQSQSGTFPGVTATRNIFSGSVQNAFLTTGDFNRNGTLDIAVGHADAPSEFGANIILANGSTSFPISSSVTEVFPGASLSDIAAGDYDEDGDLDLMFAVGKNVWRGYSMNGANFTIPAQEGTFAPGEITTRVIANDFNHNGSVDFFYLDAANDAVVILQATCSSRYSEVTVSSSPNPSIFGTDATFTITVTPRPGAPVPTGNVTLFEGATVRGIATLNGSGNAFITLSTLSVGDHVLHAVYDGDGSFAAQTSPNYTHTVNEPPFGPPINVIATGNGAANEITLQWTRAGDVASHDVLRRSNGAFVVIATGITGNSYVDTNDGGSPVVNTSAYVYAVRSHSTGGAISGLSNSDIATTATLLLSLDNIIRATDITGTRSLVNSLRSAAGLSAFSFTDVSLTGVLVKAVHVTELRTALNEARTALGFSALTFTNPTLTPTETPIRKVDVQEIRNSLM